MANQIEAKPNAVFRSDYSLALKGDRFFDHLADELGRRITGLKAFTAREGASLIFDNFLQQVGSQQLLVTLAPDRSGFVNGRVNSAYKSHVDDGGKTHEVITRYDRSWTRNKYPLPLSRWLDGYEIDRSKPIFQLETRISPGKTRDQQYPIVAVDDDGWTRWRTDRQTPLVRALSLLAPVVKPEDSLPFLVSHFLNEAYDVFYKKGLDGWQKKGNLVAVAARPLKEGALIEAGVEKRVIVADDGQRYLLNEDVFLLHSGHPGLATPSGVEFCISEDVKAASFPAKDFPPAVAEHIGAESLLIPLSPANPSLPTRNLEPGGKHFFTIRDHVIRYPFQGVKWGGGSLNASGELKTARGKTGATRVLVPGMAKLYQKGGGVAFLLDDGLATFPIEISPDQILGETIEVKDVVFDKNQEKKISCSVYEVPISLKNDSGKTARVAVPLVSESKPAAPPVLKKETVSKSQLPSCFVRDRVFSSQTDFLVVPGSPEQPLQRAISPELEAEVSRRLARQKWVHALGEQTRTFPEAGFAIINGQKRPLSRLLTRENTTLPSVIEGISNNVEVIFPLRDFRNQVVEEALLRGNGYRFPDNSSAASASTARQEVAEKIDSHYLRKGRTPPGWAIGLWLQKEVTWEQTASDKDFGAAARDIALKNRNQIVQGAILQDFTAKVAGSLYRVSTGNGISEDDMKIMQAFDNDFFDQFQKAAADCSDQPKFEKFVYETALEFAPQLLPSFMNDYPPLEEIAPNLVQNCADQLAILVAGQTIPEEKNLCTFIPPQDLKQFTEDFTPHSITAQVQIPVILHSDKPVSLVPVSDRELRDIGIRGSMVAVAGQLVQEEEDRFFFPPLAIKETPAQNAYVSPIARACGNFGPKGLAQAFRPVFHLLDKEEDLPIFNLPPLPIRQSPESVVPAAQLQIDNLYIEMVPDGLDGIEKKMFSSMADINPSQAEARAYALARFESKMIANLAALPLGSSSLFEIHGNEEVHQQFQMAIGQIARMSGEQSGWRVKMAIATLQPLEDKVRHQLAALDQAGLAHRMTLAHWSADRVAGAKDTSLQETHDRLLDVLRTNVVTSFSQVEVANGQRQEPAAAPLFIPQNTK